MDALAEPDGYASRETLLMIACDCGRPLGQELVVEELLKRRANVNLQDRYG